MNRAKCIVVLIIILVISIGGSIMWKVGKQDSNTQMCVEQKLNIELGEGVTLVESEVNEDEFGEEHLNAKFKVDKDEVETLKNNLAMRMGTEISELHRKSDIWSDVQEHTILNYYGQALEGKVVKTVIVTAYIATDDEGEYYFYIFY